MNSSNHEIIHSDLLILGGGLAGLTLALQVKKKNPDVDIVVVEKNNHPLPDATVKVGESIVEIASHYLSHDLNLEKHLKKEHLPKLGLRFFFPNGDNSDITQRFEYGQSGFLPVPTYQLDRGILENHLGQEIVKRGVKFLTECTVKETTLSGASEMHSSLVKTKAGEEKTIEAKWIVDATGRSGFLKRKLDLKKKHSHDINSYWFRIKKEIDIGSWSDDSSWLMRMSKPKEKLRRLSTNHLMGKGYWLWIIPLSSGYTSIGIVADPKFQDANLFNSREKALDWIAANEPQLRDCIRGDEDKIDDFLGIKHFTYNCKRVYSKDKWALTGEAGLFTDPFYSPGSDIISISNTILTHLIVSDFEGQDIDEDVELFNSFYLGLFTSFIVIYDQQYSMMNNAISMTLKIVWDFTIYWGGISLIYINDCLTNKDFLKKILNDFRSIYYLHYRMQGLLREFDECLASMDIDYSGQFMDYTKIQFLHDLNCDLKNSYNPEELVLKLKTNKKFMNDLAESVTWELGNRFEQFKQYEFYPKNNPDFKPIDEIRELFIQYDQYTGLTESAI